MNILYIHVTTHFLALSQTADYSVTVLHYFVYFVLKDLLYFSMFFFSFFFFYFLFVSLFEDSDFSCLIFFIKKRQ